MAQGRKFFECIGEYSNKFNLPILKCNFNQDAYNDSLQIFFDSNFRFFFILNFLILEISIVVVNPRGFWSPGPRGSLELRCKKSAKHSWKITIMLGMSINFGNEIFMKLKIVFYFNLQAPVAQKVADEVVFRLFQGEGVEFFF